MTRAGGAVHPLHVAIGEDAQRTARLLVKRPENQAEKGEHEDHVHAMAGDFSSRKASNPKYPKASTAESRRMIPAGLLTSWSTAAAMRTDAGGCFQPLDGGIREKTIGRWSFSGAAPPETRAQRRESIATEPR